MSLFADVLRPFWIRGLNEVTGRQIKEIAGWVSAEDYQIYNNVQPDRFVLNVSNTEHLVRAYAAELDRIAIASFETLARIESSRESKSISWQCIQRYYAAFFSAHSLLRVFGTGCNTLGRNQCRSVLNVANAWDVEAPTSLRAGLYCFSYDANKQEFSARHVDGGPHESFWKQFNAKLEEIANLILGHQVSFTVDIQTRQAVALKLDQLRANLRWSGAPQGGWLTQMRNRINYDHKEATWWPYSGRPKYYERLEGQGTLWRDDPLEIELDLFDECDMLRFQASCNFLIAACRDVLQDLADGCSTGDSFLKSGTIAYWNLSKILKRPSRGKRD